jgi:hypothetical protein
LSSPGELCGVRVIPAVDVAVVQVKGCDRRNLAFWTGEAGDAAGARDQFAALLPVRERVSGSEHRDTLAARANLAHWTREAGDDVDAGGN